MSTTMIAIHTIHRKGEKGLTRIPPKGEFEAGDEERAFLIAEGAAKDKVAEEPTPKEEAVDDKSDDKSDDKAAAKKTTAKKAADGKKLLG